MKNTGYILLFCVALQSCIPLHTAERVDGYNLIDNDTNDHKFTQFHIQVKPPDININYRIERFFHLKDTQSTEVFETSIFGDKNFQVSINRSSDRDKKIWLFDFLSSNTDDERRQKNKKNHRDYIRYLDITVEGPGGKDALAEGSIYRTKVIKTLREFQHSFYTSAPSF